MICAQRVVGLNPEKVNGSGRKAIRSSFAPELQQSLPVNQGTNSKTPTGIHNVEYKLHDTALGLIMWSVSNKMIVQLHILDYLCSHLSAICCTVCPFHIQLFPIALIAPSAKLKTYVFHFQVFQRVSTGRV